MISDLACAQLCQACYNTPDSFNRVVYTSDVWAGIKHYDAYTVIAMRGSTTINDWLRDFRGWMVKDPQLGMVEDGFMAGMRDVFAHLVDEIAAPAPKSLCITGHSLGAAEALILGGLITDGGHGAAIDAIVTFGSPRPGGQRLKNILTPIAVRSYRNIMDPVCEVPVRIPELEPYMHPRDLIGIVAAPPPDDPWGPIADHHIELYIKALGG